MHPSTVADVLNQHQFELCAELADKAKIKCTYVIGCDPPPLNTEAFMTSSFSNAFSLLRSNTLETMSVIFDWSLGDKGGSDWIPYTLPSHLIVTEHFVRQSIRNLILHRVAGDLYDYLGSPEYYGPVCVIGN
jgi:hypothetical protein